MVYNSLCLQNTVGRHWHRHRLYSVPLRGQDVRSENLGHLHEVWTLVWTRPGRRVSTT